MITVPLRILPSRIVHAVTDFERELDSQYKPRPKFFQEGASLAQWRVVEDCEDFRKGAYFSDYALAYGWQDNVFPVGMTVEKVTTGGRLTYQGTKGWVNSYGKVHEFYMLSRQR